MKNMVKSISTSEFNILYIISYQFQIRDSEEDKFFYKLIEKLERNINKLRFKEF